MKSEETAYHLRLDFRHRCGYLLHRRTPALVRRLRQSWKGTCTGLACSLDIDWNKPLAAKRIFLAKIFMTANDADLALRSQMVLRVKEKSR